VQTTVLWAAKVAPAVESKDTWIAKGCWKSAKIGVEKVKVLSSLKLITVASKALEGILLGPT
jgi:hypothetical protein